MTSGNSRSVFEFLREAAKKRVFQVVVAESMPQLEGHTLARKLLELGVQTTVIPDAAVFAMMARVNMVIYVFLGAITLFHGMSSYSVHLP